MPADDGSTQDNEGTSGDDRCNVIRDLIERTRKLLKSERFQEAYETIGQDRRIKIPGKLALPYLRVRSVATMYVGRFREALAVLDKALTIAPQSQTLLTQQALCYTEIGEFAPAIEQISRVIELHGRTDDRRLRAKWYLRLGQIDAAIDDAQILADTTEDYADRILLAQMYIANHDFEAAFELVDELVTRCEPDPELAPLLMRSILYSHLGADDLALADAKRAVDDHRDSAMAHVCHGMLTENLDVVAYRAHQATRLDPEIADGYVLKGLVRFADGKIDGLYTNIEKAAGRPSGLVSLILGEVWNAVAPSSAPEYMTMVRRWLPGELLESAASDPYPADDDRRRRARLADRALRSMLVWRTEDGSFETFEDFIGAGPKDHPDWYVELMTLVLDALPGPLNTG